MHAGASEPAAAPDDSAPAGSRVRLQRVLSEKLDLAGAPFDQLWNTGAAAPWAELWAVDPDRAAAEQARGLDALLGALTKTEATRLLLAQPALVVAPVAAWVEFLGALGFSRLEVKNVLIAVPEVRADC